MKFINHAEGYIEPDGGGNYSYVYQYKDHLDNIRLSYSDSNGDGVVDISELIEESNYYPFGLRHRGYNNILNGTENKFLTYNGVEFEESLDLNMYEMDLRHYDPAIARWVVQDPVIHHSQSMYNAFDNNPVFWADPSGADATSLINDIWNNSGSGETTWTNNNDGTFSGSNGRSVDCGECPKEGQTKDEYKDGKGGYRVTTKYYHAGGVNDSKAGWYSKSQYAEIIKPVAIDLAVFLYGWNSRWGAPSIVTAGSLDTFLAFMASRETVDGYFNFLESFGNSVKTREEAHAHFMASGYAEPMGVDSPFFAGVLGLASKFLGTASASVRGYSFSEVAASHMANANRRVPTQILDEVINSGKVLADPRGSRAKMYYSQITKNGSLYNIEVLYDKATNSIWHFKYSQKALGPLPSIPK